MTFQHQWLHELAGLLDKGTEVVVVSVTQTAHSTPREAGACMLVSEHRTILSIGGGNLEYEATARARRMLQTGEAHHQELYGLGATMNQCCGGAVRILFERYCGAKPRWLEHALRALNNGDDDDLVCKYSDEGVNRYVRRHDDADGGSGEQPHGGDGPANKLTAGSGLMVCRLLSTATRVNLFGAGHVGRAVVNLIVDLDFDVHWVDTRSAQFPDPLPRVVHSCATADPFACVDSSHDGEIFLVMTHSHQLDFDLCCHILKNKPHSWLGLIGSVTKRRRFEARLAEQGVTPAQLNRLHCPVGLAGVGGKAPQELAVSVAAQLLLLKNNDRPQGHLSA